MVTIACFVSPHGFGHAARACAVMQALATVRPQTRFEIFTTVPEWFFGESLAAPFSYHRLVTDVGLVQHDPLQEDLDATLQQLRTLLPFSRTTLDALASRLATLGCRLVLCDIAPLGLAVAATAGLPAVLVENFTWDWIYAAYLDVCPQLARPIALLGEVVKRYVTLHLQTQPVCRARAGAQVVAPVSRSPRQPAEQVRRALGVPASAPLVLVTMGGIAWSYRSLAALQDHPDAYFVVPGGSDEQRRRGHLVTLPHHSRFYHPDLVRASDLVVGKLGYSTLAEVYHAGAAYAYIPRARFPESPVLARFADRETGGVPITQEVFRSGEWLQQIAGMIDRENVTERSQRPHGAAAAAELIAGLLP